MGNSHWPIQVGGGRQGNASPSPASRSIFFFIFMQFLEKIGQNNRLAHPTLWLAPLRREILVLPLTVSYHMFCLIDMVSKSYQPISNSYSLGGVNQFHKALGHGWGCSLVRSPFQPGTAFSSSGNGEHLFDTKLFMVPASSARRTIMYPLDIQKFVTKGMCARDW